MSRRGSLQDITTNAEAELLHAKIISIESINRFYLHIDILSKEDRRELSDSITILGPNGGLLYKANPYKCDLNELKVYKSENGTVERCKILDLYCTDKGKQRSLRLCVDILLIDRGKRLNSVWYDYIFDYGQVVSHIKQMEPEAKLSRLDIAYYVTDALELQATNDAFIEYLGWWNTYQVRIKGYHEDTYLVDIILDNGKSVVQAVNEYLAQTRTSITKISRELKDCENSFGTVERKLRTSNHRSLNHNKQNSIDRNDPKLFNAQRYIGAFDYFKAKLNSVSKSSHEAYASSRFIRVKVISWLDPTDIYVIPYSENYVCSHSLFRSILGNYSFVKNAETSKFQANKPFRLNELILFKNTSFDKNLGEWLRGIVVACSLYDHNNLSVGFRQDDNFKHLERMLEQRVITLDDVIYRVRLIDYGYHCRSTHISMRHLKDSNLENFMKITPWSMACSLYGVFPLASSTSPAYNQRRHTSNCIALMDSWIRERILDNGRSAHFSLFIRTPVNNLSRQDLFRSKISVSLFHRYQSSSAIEESLYAPTPRAYYQNLNWFLVEAGEASDSEDINSESSHIQLDEYIVNKVLTSQFQQ